MKILRLIKDLYLYTSLHISLCSVLLYWFTCLVMSQRIEGDYSLFLFCGTMIIYNVHRLVGIVKGKEIISDRFDKYRGYQYFLIAALLVCIALGSYAFLKIAVAHWLWLIVAMTLSLLYVFPIFPSKKRLRDFDLLKIWIIALVWALLTFAVPNGIFSTKGILLFMERILFFVAITIPFDVRDMYIDNHQKVKTLPSVLGVDKSLYSAKAILIIGLVLVAVTYYFYRLEPIFLWSYLLTYVVTFILIHFTDKDRSDIYYTGFLDGMIGLPYIFWVILNGLI